MDELVVGRVYILFCELANGSMGKCEGKFLRAEGKRLVFLQESTSKEFCMDSETGKVGPCKN